MPTDVKVRNYLMAMAVFNLMEGKKCTYSLTRDRPRLVASNAAHFFNQLPLEEKQKHAGEFVGMLKKYGIEPADVSLDLEGVSL